MRCPTCKAEMRRPGLAFSDWCPRCGTVAGENANGEWVRVPELVARVRELWAEEAGRVAGHVPTAADVSEGEG